MLIFIIILITLFFIAKEDWGYTVLKLFLWVLIVANLLYYEWVIYVIYGSPWDVSILRKCIALYRNVFMKKKRMIFFIVGVVILFFAVGKIFMFESFSNFIVDKAIERRIDKDKNINDNAMRYVCNIALFVDKNESSLFCVWAIESKENKYRSKRLFLEALEFDRWDYYIRTLRSLWEIELLDKNYDIAMKYCNQAISDIDERGPEEGMYRLHGLKWRILFWQEKYLEAIEFLKMWMESDMDSARRDATLWLTLSYNEIGYYSLAKDYAEKFLDYDWANTASMHDLIKELDKKIEWVKYWSY